MTKKAPRGPLPPCPRKDVIQAVQFQFFDNGPNPGKGNSEYTIALEVYCEGRLDLYRPYWKRVVRLMSPKQVMEWADKKQGEGYLTAEQHAEYRSVFEACEVVAQDPDMAWVKMGCIEDRSARIRYPGQLLMVTREVTGPMQIHVVLNGEVISAERMLHDQRSTKGTGRRKAFGWWDPSNLYDIAKKEEAMKAKAAARAAE
jgi:hypothetical protein